MHYTVYIKGQLNQMVPVEVDYEEMIFKLENGEDLTTAETILLEQLQPELLDRYFETNGVQILIDHPIV
jgi:hypothetical protein